MVTDIASIGLIVIMFIIFVRIIVLHVTSVKSGGEEKRKRNVEESKEKRKSKKRERKRSEGEEREKERDKG